MDTTFVPIDLAPPAPSANVFRVYCKGKLPEQVEREIINIWCAASDKIVVELHDPTSMMLIVVSAFIFGHDFSHICTLKVIGAVHPYDFQFTV